MARGGAVRAEMAGAEEGWFLPSLDDDDQPGSSRLAQHMAKQGVAFEVVTYPWFLSLFANTLPLEPMLRAWDCFFHEGAVGGNKTGGE